MKFAFKKDALDNIDFYQAKGVEENPWNYIIKYDEFDLEAVISDEKQVAALQAAIDIINEFVDQAEEISLFSTDRNFS